MVKLPELTTWFRFPLLLHFVISLRSNVCLSLNVPHLSAPKSMSQPNPAADDPTCTLKVLALNVWSVDPYSHNLVFELTVQGTCLYLQRPATAHQGYRGIPQLDDLRYRLPSGVMDLQGFRNRTGGAAPEFAFLAVLPHVRPTSSPCCPLVLMGGRGALGSGLAIFTRFPLISAQALPYSLSGSPHQAIEGDFFVKKAAANVVVLHPLLGEIEIWNTHVGCLMM